MLTFTNLNNCNAWQGLFLKRESLNFPSDKTIPGIIHFLLVANTIYTFYIISLLLESQQPIFKSLWEKPAAVLSVTYKLMFMIHHVQQSLNHSMTFIQVSCLQWWHDEQHQNNIKTFMFFIYSLQQTQAFAPTYILLWCILIHMYNNGNVVRLFVC